MLVDPVTAFEIEAYVDHELDLARRMAVEEHLAQHADLAARVMHDLSARTALRLLQEPLAADAALSAAAQRLAIRLSRRHGPLAQLFTPLRLVVGAGAAGVVALVAALLASQPAIAKTPQFVGEAAQSYRTGLLRAAMRSQVETPLFDPRDIERETRLQIPALRADWRIIDVQIFPSDDGPALQVMARTAAGKLVAVFAVHTDDHAPVRPVALQDDDASIAYWRRGDIGYALVGGDPPGELDAVAEDLADNRLS